MIRSPSGDTDIVVLDVSIFANQKVSIGNGQKMDLVTFTEEILNGKLHFFLCTVTMDRVIIEK